MIIRLLSAMVIAYASGKLMERIHLPAILGWLCAGILLGPNAFGVLTSSMMETPIYESEMHVMECFVGVMIGEELMLSKLKKSGKQLVIITLVQSLGTFVFVTLCFGVCFYFLKLPIYLAFIFGGIALATAPAPALSIVKEFHTKGPVTKTLVPMAALDDIVGVIVFFTVIAIVSTMGSASAMSPIMIPVMILVPLIIGGLFGYLAVLLLKKTKHRLLCMILCMIVASLVGNYINQNLMPQPLLNFLLLGMAFSAILVNCLEEHMVEDIMKGYLPILQVSMILVILNLGAPLDYHYVASAGVFTFIYIIARAIGKYGGAYIGGSITKADVRIKRYLGLTLLPHSGVSLVFTGIACSVLAGIDQNALILLQGTITAAAIINELIAVLAAKKGFELAGELN